MTQERRAHHIEDGREHIPHRRAGKRQDVRRERIYRMAARPRHRSGAVTASTGIAATHIGGFTIHSWSGIGVLNDLTDYDLDRIANTERVVRRVRNAKVLIIDEISMLSASTLSMVDRVCRAVRASERSFGGLQVVFVGDFLPACRRGDAEGCEPRNRQR